MWFYNIIFFHFKKKKVSRTIRRIKRGVTQTFWKQPGVSWCQQSSDLQHILAIIVVLAFPPRLSFSSHVSTESL